MMGDSREELFKAYMELSYQVSDLGAIVQNEIDLTRKEVQNWIEQANKVHNKLTLLQSQTTTYLVRRR